jgi:hypothetical protein
VTDLVQRSPDAIRSGIRHMQSTGEITVEVDDERASAALLAGIQSGVLMMLVTGTQAQTVPSCTG